MATATKRRPTKRAASKPVEAEVEELETDEVEDDADELEELEEDEVEEAPKAKKKGADDVVFGVSDLCKFLTKRTGKNVTPRELRTLIRKMARDGSGRVEREIVAGNRSRYNWSGPKDPEVVRIIKAFEGGELEEDKKEKLAQLKERKAQKDAAAKKIAGKKATATKRKPAPVVEDDEDEEELEMDDDE